MNFLQISSVLHLLLENNTSLILLFFHVINTFLYLNIIVERKMQYGETVFFKTYFFIVYIEFSDNWSKTEKIPVIKAPISSLKILSLEFSIMKVSFIRKKCNFETLHRNFFQHECLYTYIIEIELLWTIFIKFCSWRHIMDRWTMFIFNIRFIFIWNIFYVSLLYTVLQFNWNFFYAKCLIWELSLCH